MTCSLHGIPKVVNSGPSPKQVAFSPDSKELWVTSMGGESARPGLVGLDVFDPVSGAKLDHIPLGPFGAVEVLFSRDGKRVYASQMHTASVYEIDRDTRKVLRQLKTGGTWSKVMAFSPDEKTLYVANWVSNDISAIAIDDGKVRKFKTVKVPRGLYPTPDGRRLYIAGFGDGKPGDGKIAYIDLATGEHRVIFDKGRAMRHLVGDPERGVIYADDMGLKKTFVIDLKTDEVRELATTHSHPNTMALSPDKRVLYVSNRGANGPDGYYKPGPQWGSVLALDPATGRQLDLIKGGNQTTGLDVSSDGRWLAFSDFLDGKVQIAERPSAEALLAGNGGCVGRLSVEKGAERVS